MSNTHGTPDTLKEWQAIGGDLLPACLLTSAGVTAPGSGLTITAASCTAYARSGVDLVYIDQGAVSVTVPNVAGSHWLIAHRDTYSAVASWTRRAGSHFLTQQSATQPTIPDACVLVAQLTVAGGNITAVDTTPALSPPLSRQTADAVDITGGRISIGGHSSTGVLDVQGSVVASDAANQYYGPRMWPVAPAGATGVHALKVEPGTGAAVGTATFTGLSITDQPVSSGQVLGLALNLTAGANRFNINTGTAQSRFNGNVGIGMTPSYPLDVTGNVQVTGFLGLRTPPVTNRLIDMRYTPGTHAGIQIQPTADTGGTYAMLFNNAAGTGVGNISTTASATTYATSSDRRLKEAIAPLTDALATVLALAPVTFRWRVDGSVGHGFVADEVQALVPEAVTGEVDAVDADGHLMPQGLDMSKFMPWVVSALQEVIHRLDALEAHVTAPPTG